MASVCVFCGSSKGYLPLYAEAARELGKCIALSGSVLVYGGGKIGLMGIAADEALAYDGEVIGVIPDFLYQKEVGHDGVTRLEIVQTMHERKKKMADLADAFVAMPGGWGTLDELAEILTWKQLGLIHQPVALLNTNSFFTPLLQQFQKMAEEGFLNEGYLKSLIVAETPQRLLTSIGVVAV